MKDKILLIIFSYKINVKNFIILLFIIFFVGGYSLSFGKSHKNLVLNKNFLKPCPKKPNCVLSLSSDPKQKIKPIRFFGSLKEAKKKLKTVILLISEVNFVAETDLYWHIEFISSWLGFIDDVEIYFDEIKSLIHVRSASRVGYWDFGANRKRIEEIRFNFSSFPTKN